jgi:hypothetical protein
MKSEKSGKSRFLPELIPVSILIFAVLLIFGKVIFSGETLYGSDFVLQFYPWKKFLYDYVQTHVSLPFWNPHLFSGTPFIANIQASMFYPLGFLYYLIPTEFAYLYSTMLHCILGSVFMYMFMRSLSVSKSGAFLSGFIFIFNGYLMAHIYAGHLSFVQNYIWIPLIFLFLIRFAQLGSFKYAIASGLTLGVQILGGFPQIAFYTILAIAAYLLFCAIDHVRGGESKSANTVCIGFVIILCVGFCLAAIQVLPTLEFSALSGRAGGVSYEFATSDSLDPRDLFAFLIPDIFGNIVDNTYWKSRETWHFWETCGYVGILPLLFIFVKTKYSYLRSLRSFCILLVLGSLFLALGKHNLLYPVIYELPGFGSFRIPAQIIFLYIFGIAVLSGIGLHGIQENDVRLSRGFAPFFVFTGALLLFLIIGLSFFPYDLFHYLFKHFAIGKIQGINVEKLYERVCFSVDKSTLILFGSAFLILIRAIRRFNLQTFSILAIGIVVVDLYVFAGGFIKPYHFKVSSQKERITSLLYHDATKGRVAPDASFFMPNDALRYGFPSILGYDPLILKRYIHYIQHSQDQTYDDHVVNLSHIRNPNVKLLQLLNLRQTISGERTILIGNSVPYCNFVSKVIVKSSDKVLPFMKSERFDPKQMVIFESEYGESISQTEGGNVNGSYTVLSYENEIIRIKTSSDRKGYLVLSEIFYPGWQTIVDGKNVPVRCGNYIFRAIPLERGDHDVSFKFVSWPFRVGAVISFFTLIGCIWFMFRRTYLGNP